MSTIKVVAAAVKGSKDGEAVIYSLPPPARHHTILHHYHLGNEGKRGGFLLSDGSFATRTLAWKVAMAAGQLFKKNPSQIQGVLYSEDLW